MSTNPQLVYHEIVVTLRKIAFLFVEIGLAISGAISASVLLIYGLGFVHYISSDCGFGTLAFVIISVVQTIWLILAKLLSLLSPPFFVDKLGIWLLPSLKMSFARGFVFGFLYVFLWVFNERIPHYIGDEFVFLSFFIVSPLLDLMAISFLEKKVSAYGWVERRDRPSGSLGN